MRAAVTFLFRQKRLPAGRRGSLRGLYLHPHRRMKSPHPIATPFPVPDAASATRPQACRQDRQAASRTAVPGPRTFCRKSGPMQVHGSGDYHTVRGDDRVQHHPEIVPIEHSPSGTGSTPYMAGCPFPRAGPSKGSPARQARHDLLHRQLAVPSFRGTRSPQYALHFLRCPGTACDISGTGRIYPGYGRCQCEFPNNICRYSIST